MNLTALDIKEALASELEKQGSSLEEFEKSLAEISKTAADPNKNKNRGGGGGSMFKLNPVDVISKLPYFGLAPVSAGVALGGMPLLEAYKANLDSSDQIDKKMREQQEYEHARMGLEQAFRDKQTQM